jgi:hypothetical protein
LGHATQPKKLLHKHVSSSAEKFFPFLTLPASKLAMVALTELSGRKTSPCKEAIFCRDRELLGVKRQFGGRGLEAVGSPKFFRARHAPLAGAVTVHTADALNMYKKDNFTLHLAGDICN